MWFFWFLSDLINQVTKFSLLSVFRSLVIKVDTTCPNKLADDSFSCLNKLGMKQIKLQMWEIQMEWNDHTHLFKKWNWWICAIWLIHGCLFLFVLFLETRTSPLWVYWGIFSMLQSYYHLCSGFLFNLKLFTPTFRCIMAADCDYNHCSQGVSSIHNFKKRPHLFKFTFYCL